MNKLRFIICLISINFLTQGCKEILEPVSFVGNLASDATNIQEEFSIDINSLTFASARKANMDPYPRQIMRTGSGSQANVFNEADFLTARVPETSRKSDYLVGIGDELSFIQLNEFLNKIPEWPLNSTSEKYLLGVGDQLTFVQLKSDMSLITSSVQLTEENKAIASSISKEAILETVGVIGTDGNILLLGLGSISAAGRTLKDVRGEARNILIRNGLVPNFQLEITEFNSQKAYLTTTRGESQVISINNLPITLQELALSAGISEASKNLAILTLIRDSKEYRITAEQLFNLSAPKVNIKNKDQIEMQIVAETSTSTTSMVGSRGNILLPGVGKIKAVDKTLKDLQIEVSKALSKKGLRPNFQLELTNFASKKAYLVNRESGSVVIPLTNKNITLRELILNSNSPTTTKKGLAVFTLQRNGQVFRVTGDQIIDPKNPQIWIQEGDQISIETMVYKPGQVYALGGSGSAQIVPIDPSKRETLADILFVNNGALSNTLAKRSEVYLLRGRKPSLAYHLDAQNVSRLLVAAKTELRPNDIIFVADRPIISFARTLAEINPLRVLMRDLDNGNIP
jgi:protein involved in polysaccharide export with SLBB domain